MSNNKDGAHVVHVAAWLAHVRQLTSHGAHAGPSRALVVTYSLLPHAETHLFDVKFKYANAAHDVQLVDALTQVKQLASQAAQAGPPRPLTVWNWLSAHEATHSLEVRSKSEPDPQVVHVDAEPTQVRQLTSHGAHAGPSRALVVSYSLLPHAETHLFEVRFK